MIDFIRFDYSGDEDFGFKSYVVFGEETESNIQGCAIHAESNKELREKLRRARGFVGVASEKPEVNRYAVMRKKVDVLLDFPGRRLDYPTFKLAREKDVLIEVSLATLMKLSRSRRVKHAEELRVMFRVINKFDTPFILTSGAADIYGMRRASQIKDVFSYFGANTERARYWSERLYRRFFDDSYIMDGLEVI
ncbi:RNase P/RNase MRP subunit p30 [Geoglobus ahangari]|uniref:Ribonuclease P protein component 3 n=1 Tax=Geoglobus ahangari TaxID=113653 RepID=A0A0F7IEQ1_9EURY|nr:RNase P subunit p30 family protein [Geoglobus ahangari]AKG92058.1 RNase P/RNase MRP subunit p30 [Geoglobus ahangari]